MTLLFSQSGEESLTIFVDKRKLSQEPPSLSVVDRSLDGGSSSNTSGAVTLEALHQLAASYFTDRESTLRRLHHLQIASSAVRVRVSRGTVAAPRDLLSLSRTGNIIYEISRRSFPV